MQDFLLNEKKFKRRVEELSWRRYVEMQSIAPLNSVRETRDPDSVHVTIPCFSNSRSMLLGEEFAGNDCYLWLQKDILMPCARPGYNIVGLFDFSRIERDDCSHGFEAMMFLDGHPFIGVDNNHSDVLLNSFEGKSVQITFMIWSGLNIGESQTVIHHRLCQADIGYVHKATEELYYLSRALTEALPCLSDNDPDKYALIDAMNDALACIDWDVDSFYETTPKALDVLSHAIDKIGKQSKVTVNCVGHTHIDVAWLWRLKHTREKVMRSFSTVIRLMEEFDDYYFLQTQPQLYAYIKQDCPELYKQIQDKVAEGKWEADGAMWLEADCNVTAGESLVRQLVHGMRFFKEEFGKTCKFLWLPDVFGYSWALPQILKLAGIQTFITTKISWNQYNDMPDRLFRWRGIDGSEILTYFITTPNPGQPSDSFNATYNGVITPETVSKTWERFPNKDITRNVLISYGFGDGGGGVTRDMLQMRRASDRIPGLPHVKTSTAGEFFRQIHADSALHPERLSTWDGELYLEYHRGTYTSQARNKRWNRLLEQGLCEAEWLGAWTGIYDAAAMEQAWKIVLRNQFHDIIPGSSIRKVYEDSALEYQRAFALCSKMAKESSKGLCLPAQNRFVLYHFCSFERCGIVEIPIKDAGRFLDSNGNSLLCQRTPNGYMVCASLPALGATEICFSSESPAEETPCAVLDPEQRTIETSFYRIRWSQTGALCEIFDKTNMRNVLAPNSMGNVLEIFEDKPIDYDAWDIDRFYRQKQEFASLVHEPELCENGAVRAVLHFVYVYRHSHIEQDMILYSQDRRIDFSTKVNWNEEHRLLKTAFTVDIRSCKASFDIQYGFVERPTHENTSWDRARFEVVGHKWADLSQQDYGVSLLNDCKYGYSIRDNEITLSLLKSSKYPDPEADMGDHIFTYALLPHSGTVTEGGTIEAGCALNSPIRWIPGTLKSQTAFPLLTLSSNSLIIDAVKPCDTDDSAVIFRLHECRGARCTFNIQTARPISRWAPCDLLECETQSPCNSTYIADTAHPFAIKCYKVWFK